MTLQLEGKSLGKVCAFTPHQQAGEYDSKHLGSSRMKVTLQGQAFSPGPDAVRPDGCCRGEKKPCLHGAAGEGRTQG